MRHFYSINVNPPPGDIKAAREEPKAAREEPGQHGVTRFPSLLQLKFLAKMGVRGTEDAPVFWELFRIKTQVIKL
jgi:hypothetical protein